MKRPSSAFERGARVEPEPAQPQDQHAQPEQRHVVPRDRPWLAVRPVLAPARAEQQQRRKRAGCTDQVDRRRACEVLHSDDARTEPVAHLQEAAAEHPVGADRVDHHAEHQRVDDVRAELDPLECGSPDDRQRHGAEGELEEELRLDRRVRERHDPELGREQGQPVRFCRIRTEVGEEEPGRMPDQVTGAEGEREPADPPAERRDREVREDLRDHGPRVLASGEPDLQEREAGLHEHHDHPGDDHPEGVDADGLLELTGDPEVRALGLCPRPHRGGQ